MSAISAILLAYFLGGLLILIVFDLITKRIRSNIPSAGLQAQIRMVEANNLIGKKSGLVLMLALTWLAWPTVLIGAATERWSEDRKAQRQEEGVLSRDTAIGTRSQFSYLIKKIWYGECPKCHVILGPASWNRTVCPICGTRFGMLIRRNNKNGTSRETTPGESSDRAGAIDSGNGESQADGEQPNRAPNTETSKP